MYQLLDSATKYARHFLDIHNVYNNYDYYTIITAVPLNEPCRKVEGAMKLCSECEYLRQKLFDDEVRRVDDLPRWQYNEVDYQQQVDNYNQFVVAYHLATTTTTTTTTACC